MIKKSKKKLSLDKLNITKLDIQSDIVGGRQQRSNIIIATKCAFPISESIIGRGNESRTDRPGESFVPEGGHRP